MAKLRSADDLQALRQQYAAEMDRKKTRVRVCMTGCRAFGAEEVRGAFRNELESRGLADQVEVRETGCHGFCSQAPVAVIDPQNIFYQGLDADAVPEIVERSLLRGEIVEQWLYREPETGQKVIDADEVPFYKGQTKNVLRHCGIIDPTRISHYLARGGYSALEKVLFGMEPEAVIEEITRSGLRGRGGAGFPTGKKWGLTRSAPGDTKYVICNGDEGDPGAFMDRAVLEGDPHSVVEGMLIAAYAIGASSGYFYVRAEYPIAVEHLRIAISQVEELGLVGKDILGSGIDIELEIRQGAGAFVCGEETALTASIEGERGMPRPRPPFPAQSGLWDKPTNINNVETCANVPLIILNGADWYSDTGTDRGKGTKILALAGHINNTGLVEVPIGSTLREVIYDVGGGVLKDGEFKAAQLGGPSGGCVPAEHLDLPLDYESLKSVGAIMGSGGMVILDGNTCMVDTARFFLEFTQHESCGKCVPCRLGTKRMLEILDRITNGGGREGDIELLEELSEGVKDASLCGLGQTAPNPVLSTIQYFRDEYQTHIEDKCCPTFVCQGLTSYYIDPKKCTACLICLRNCPTEAIIGAKHTIHYIEQDLCSGCGTCFEVCPDRFSAVVRLSGVPIPPPLPEGERILARAKKK
jgi:NADH:ubiquinone oxidoreductase subunit F (NADH-binding)/(2Fe-2S) ferredoxin/ferredoxin